ncbi:hypothetical protein MKW94_006860 [Papaver nudicaule]|uniref:Uncharacterized protein n=1 Tax=Papaver nudicaule TaxID=74823 RepID=A0AA41S1I3_PAPNU|nr:hypothetical protein [Papaver nudicaule]
MTLSGFFCYCSFLPMDVLLQIVKVGVKHEIRIHKSFHASMVQAAGYEELKFDRKDVRNVL